MGKSYKAGVMEITGNGRFVKYPLPPTGVPDGCYDVTLARKSANAHEAQVISTLSDPKQRIMGYLMDREGEWVGPTTIGQTLQPSRMHGSTWGSKHCLELVKVGLLRRNKGGQYRYYPKKSVAE